MTDAAFDAIIDTSTLSTFIDTFQSVVTETNLQIDEDGIYGEPQDPATVAVVNQTLEPSAFESYQTSGVRFGVNLERVDDFLSTADGDLLHLSLDEETRMLNLECGRADYSMACIDPDSVRNGINIDEEWTFVDGLSADVSVEAAALSHAVSLVNLSSDHVVLDADPDRENPVHVIGEGDTDDMRVRFGDSLQEGSNVEDACQSIFSHEYVERLVGEIPKSAEVRVRFGEEFPLRMDYEHSDGHASVSMGCAPRIQTR